MCHSAYQPVCHISATSQLCTENYSCCTFLYVEKIFLFLSFGNQKYSSVSAVRFVLCSLSSWFSVNIFIFIVSIRRKCRLEMETTEQEIKCIFDAVLCKKGIWWHYLNPQNIAFINKINNKDDMPTWANIFHCRTVYLCKQCINIF